MKQRTMKKSYIKPIFSYSMVGSLGLTIVAALQGCEKEPSNYYDPSAEQAPPPSSSSSSADQGSINDAAQSEAFFLVIQQTGANPDTYELVEKYPSSNGTRAILKDMEGNERMLSEAELKELAEAEAKKVEEGTSALNQPVAESGGLGLGEMILASAAGALIGGMLANALMGNRNFQQHQQQADTRAKSSVSSTKDPAKSNTNTSGSNKSQTKSGYFNSNQSNPSNKSSSSSSSSSSFGG